MTGSIEAISCKEPDITEDMEDSDEDDGSAGLPDFNKGQRTFLKCRSLRIGSYKVLMPTMKVMFVSEGIRITVPPITEADEKELVTIDIPIKKIVKILGHFGRCLPVFFVYVKPSMGSIVRNALNMNDQSGLYFDPSSLDESQKRITILPDKFNETSRSVFKDLFKYQVSGSSRFILDEIDQKEANEILVRSSPENLPAKPTATKKPQVKNKLALLRPKEKSPVQERGKPYDKPGIVIEPRLKLDNKPKSIKIPFDYVKPSLQIGSRIKLVDDQCSIKRTYHDKNPSHQVGTRIKLVNEVIGPAEAEPVTQKEPVITADIENSEKGEEQKGPTLAGGGLPGFFKKLAEGTLNSPKVSLKCRSIRIGSYKVLTPKEKIMIIPQGIRMIVPPITKGDENEMMTIDIPINKVVKVLAHFGRSLPVFFVYVQPSVAKTIQNSLKMTDQSGLYFDPCSLDESQKRITVLPDKFMESSRSVFKEIFKSESKSTHLPNYPGQIHASSSTSSNSILDEIDQREANEILIRSSPETPSNVKMAKVRRHEEEKDDPITSAKIIKTEESHKRAIVKQKRKQRVIVQQEGDQHIIFEVENDEEIFDDPSYIDKFDEEPIDIEIEANEDSDCFEEGVKISPEKKKDEQMVTQHSGRPRRTNIRLPAKLRSSDDFSIQVQLPHLRKILPKKDPNQEDTDTGEEGTDAGEPGENQKNKMEQSRTQVSKSENTDSNQNQTVKALSSQVPMFFCIQPINSTGQTVFQPKQVFEQKGEVLDPIKQIIQIPPIKQEKMDDGSIQQALNTISLAPNTIQMAPNTIQLAPNTPQVIMLLPEVKSVAVPNEQGTLDSDPLAVQEAKPL